jgi:TonB family protein
MAFFSDTQETAARYGPYIGEFQELCNRHEVSSGTPEDLYRLAPKLACDERFRAEFCNLTKSMAQREGGRLTLTRALTVIAVAMGGESVDAIGTAGAVPVSMIVVFLAGVGGWSEGEEAIVEKADESHGVGVGDQAAVTDQEEREGLELERRLAAGPSDIESMASALFGGPTLMKEALSRLELNTLQLKLHLDSIDSRMERIEPHLDDLTSRLTTAEPVMPAFEHRERMSLPVVRYSQLESRVAVANEVTVPVNSPLVVPVSTPIVPTAVHAAPANNPSELRRLHRLVTALGILLVAMAAVVGILVYVNRGNLLKAKLENVLAMTATNASSTTATVTPPSVIDHAGTNSEIPVSAVSTPAIRNNASPIAASPQPSKPEQKPFVIPNDLGLTPRKININKRSEEEAPTAPAIHLADVLPGAVAVRSAEGPGVSSGGEIMQPAANTSAVTAMPVAATGNTAIGTREPRTKVFVPANTLLHSVIASPHPVYPAVARAQRVEGDVVLQALVDESGKIETVSVVSGPEPLRDAAMSAMKNWRFKPYQLDGRPVAVRTFVDFHFNLNK